LPYPWLEIRDGVCRTRDFRISKEFLNAGFESLKKAAGCRFEQQFTEIKPIFVLEAANN
jgi:hypothetical protein